MNYIAAMRSILQLDEKIYQEIHVAGKAATFCMVNVLICGLLYGFFVMHFIESMVQDAAARKPCRQPRSSCTESEPLS
jgi:hypothetical protein